VKAHRAVVLLISTYTYAWEAPCSNDAVLLGVRVSRPRIDESTCDWCNHFTAKHVNRQPFPPPSPNASPTPGLSRGAASIRLPNRAARRQTRGPCPRPRVWSYGQTRGLHMQKIENSLARSVDAFLPLHRCVPPKPLRIGGDFDVNYMIRCTCSEQ
jgi:hypothetical protein